MKKTLFCCIACLVSICIISAQNTDISYVDLDIEDLMRVKIHEDVHNEGDTLKTVMNFTNEEIHEKRIQNLYEVMAICLRSHNLPKKLSSIKIQVYNNMLLADKQAESYLHYCIDDVQKIEVDWVASSNTAKIYVTH